MTRVDVVDFGDAADAAGLVAEFDAEANAVRVNARAVARVRALLGAREAERFVVCAVAHERHHRADPQASEAAAHAAGRRLRRRSAAVTRRRFAPRAPRPTVRA